MFSGICKMLLSTVGAGLQNARPSRPFNDEVKLLLIVSELFASALVCRLCADQGLISTTAKHQIATLPSVMA